MTESCIDILLGSLPRNDPAYTAKNDVHRLSLTKKCSIRKLAVVNTTKKILRRDIFGHQNDCDKSP